MNLNIDNTRKTGVLAITGELTIQYSTELKTWLSDALNQLEKCRLDLKGVTAIDLSCIQLIYAACDRASNMNKQLCLPGEYPEIFKEAIAVSGSSRRDWLGPVSRLEEEIFNTNR